VLADAENIKADLIGQLGLLEEVTQPLCRVDLRADVGEGVKAQFHHRFLSARARCTQTSGDGLDAWKRRSRKDRVPLPNQLVVGLSRPPNAIMDFH
jgi:hypothetical protein